MHMPQYAIKELHRCVKQMDLSEQCCQAQSMKEFWTTGGLMHSAPRSRIFMCLISAPASSRQVPRVIYNRLVHKKYLSAPLGLASWGCHNEAAINALRLAVSGAIEPASSTSPTFHPPAESPLDACLQYAGPQ
jgi:hypothetical protein